MQLPTSIGTFPGRNDRFGVFYISEDDDGYPIVILVEPPIYGKEVARELMHGFVRRFSEINVYISIIKEKDTS